jgi:7,8-dihydroneopterin aldolase/epimerase/oxygenase
MAIIAIEAIELTAHHGVYEAEKISGNTFVVDVYLDADVGRAASTDALEDTLDYQVVYNMVLEEMRIRANLLETLASRMGHRILHAFPSVQSTKIRISKLRPLHLEACTRTYVEMTFDRNHAATQHKAASLADTFDT